MKHRIIQRTRATTRRGFRHLFMAQCTGWGVA
jgi:hypothetical protein